MKKELVPFWFGTSIVGPIVKSIDYGIIPSDADTPIPASFSATLLSSLTPEVATGSATPTFTRATTAYVMGYDASAVSGASQQLILCAAGEARFSGARRVAENSWSQVLSDASAIPTAELLGYQAEGARTNYALWGRDLTNAAWVSGGGGIATAKTATGADGTANGATTLTASGANGTLIQSITRASAQRVTGCRIKRRTGSGTVNMTQDNGGTWTAVTVTADWTAVAVPAATAANPNIGFRIVTSGDAIDVDFVMHEEAAFVSSPIPTTTVAVTRNADVLSYAGASNLDLTIGTAYAEYQAAGFPGNQGIIAGTGVPRVLMCDNATTSWMYDGANLPTTGAGTSALNNTVKAACAWGGAGMYIDRSGSTTTTSAFDGSLESGPEIQIGANSGNQLFGCIRNVSIWTIKKTQAEVEALVA